MDRKGGDRGSWVIVPDRCKQQGCMWGLGLEKALVQIKANCYMVVTNSKSLVVKGKYSCQQLPFMKCNNILYILLA